MRATRRGFFGQLIAAAASLTAAKKASAVPVTPTLPTPTLPTPPMALRVEPLVEPVASFPYPYAISSVCGLATFGAFDYYDSGRGGYRAQALTYRCVHCGTVRSTHRLPVGACTQCGSGDLKTEQSLDRQFVRGSYDVHRPELLCRLDTTGEDSDR